MCREVLTVAFVFFPSVIAVVMNSSAELLSQFPQNRATLHLRAMNLRLLNHFDEALAGCG
jgi:hypothetical protein